MRYSLGGGAPCWGVLLCSQHVVLAVVGHAGRRRGMSLLDLEFFFLFFFLAGATSEIGFSFFFKRRLRARFCVVRLRRPVAPVLPPAPTPHAPTHGSGGGEHTSLPRSARVCYSQEQDRRASLRWRARRHLADTEQRGAHPSAERRPLARARRAPTCARCSPLGSHAAPGASSCGSVAVGAPSPPPSVDAICSRSSWYVGRGRYAARRRWHRGRRLRC